jgi:hypothetical protein
VVSYFLNLKFPMNIIFKVSAENNKNVVTEMAICLFVHKDKM